MHRSLQLLSMLYSYHIFFYLVCKRASDIIRDDDTIVLLFHFVFIGRFVSFVFFYCLYLVRFGLLCMSFPFLFILYIFLVLVVCFCVILCFIQFCVFLVYFTWLFSSYYLSMLVISVLEGFQGYSCFHF